MTDLNQSYHARGGDIYHLDPLCPVGRQIPGEWRVSGTAELAVCPTCWARTRAKQPSGPYVPPNLNESAQLPEDRRKPRGGA
jgi:hypothetical protein